MGASAPMPQILPDSSPKPRLMEPCCQDLRTLMPGSRPRRWHRRRWRRPIGIQPHKASPPSQPKPSRRTGPCRCRLEPPSVVRPHQQAGDCWPSCWSSRPPFPWPRASARSRSIPHWSASGPPGGERCIKNPGSGWGQGIEAIQKRHKKPRTKPGLKT